MPMVQQRNSTAPAVMRCAGKYLIFFFRAFVSSLASSAVGAGERELEAVAGCCC